MTNELGPFSQRRPETKSEDLRTPTLDIFDVLTLAEELAANPTGTHIKRLVKQIVDNCARGDMANIRGAAQRIGKSDVPELDAIAIIEECQAILQARDAEVVEIAVAI